MYFLSVLFIKNKKTNYGLLVACLYLCLSGCAGMNSQGFDAAFDSASSRAADGYRLFPGDTVNVQVYREPQLSGLFRVDDGGFIRHPLCGSFKAEGLTPAEVETKLTSLLGENYLVNPSVIVTIDSAQNSHVVILGEVVSPGIHPVLYGEDITLLQAIAAAGGFTDLASVNRVTVTRSVDGKEQSIRVRVSKMISGEEPDMLLKPDDVVMVPQVVF